MAHTYTYVKKNDSLKVDQWIKNFARLKYTFKNIYKPEKTLSL